MFSSQFCTFSRQRLQFVRFKTSGLFLPATRKQLARLRKLKKSSNKTFFLAETPTLVDQLIRSKLKIGMYLLLLLLLHIVFQCDLFLFFVCSKKDSVFVEKRLIEQEKTSMSSVFADLPTIDSYHDTSIIPKLAADASLRESVFACDNDVLESVVDVKASPGIVAVAHVPDTFTSVSKQEHLSTLTGLVVVLTCDDPKNVGSVVRIAEAFDAALVLCVEGFASPFNARAVRASAGSVFRQPMRRVPADHVARLQQLLPNHHIVGAAATRGTDIQLKDFSSDENLCVVLGNEKQGILPLMTSSLHERITIPLNDNVESLNVASAASIICYEWWRARK